MFRYIKRFFIGIKLFIKDRSYFRQWKAYMSWQDGVRKSLIKQAKDFDPWSGYKMHCMIVTMLTFFEKVYSSGNCIWREDESRLEIAKSIREALDYANDLEKIEYLTDEELLTIAMKDGVAFTNYKKKFEDKLGKAINKKLLAGVAHEYLENKYTKHFYNLIGSNIWRWYD